MSMQNQLENVIFVGFKISEKSEFIIREGLAHFEINSITDRGTLYEQLNKLNINLWVVCEIVSDNQDVIMVQPAFDSTESVMYNTIDMLIKNVPFHLVTNEIKGLCFISVKLLLEKLKTSRVLVLCQRTHGPAEGFNVEETIIPTLEDIIKNHLHKMTGSDKTIIEYMSSFDSSEPRNKATFNIKFKDSEKNPEVKEFVDNHLNFYDLIVLQTCPFKFIDLTLINSILKQNGHVICTTIYDDGINHKVPIPIAQLLVEKFNAINFFPVPNMTNLTFQFKNEKPEKRVLVLCQRKEGIGLGGMNVKEKLIPKLETIITNFLQKMTGSYTKSIEYMTYNDIGKPKIDSDKADFFMLLTNGTKEVKKFLNDHLHFYDLIVLQTCPFKLMDLEIINSILKKEGYVMCTSIQIDGRNAKILSDNKEILFENFGRINFFPISYADELTFQSM
jgi:hypothetical protein